MLFDLFTRFVKFCLVGATCAGIDFGVTIWGKEKLKFKNLTANSMGFSASAISNFFLNKHFTFVNQNPNITEQFIKFLGVALVGLAINNSLVYLFSERRNKNFYLSKIMATAIVMFWNFFINYFFTFK